MATQKQRGNAFEYACLQAFYIRLKDLQEITVEDSKAVKHARNSYNSVDGSLREKMQKASDAAVKVILQLEPQLLYPNGNTPLYLDIQEDARGQQGDVRDILCLRNQNAWEIGLSCKHNHSAVKHSRLSKLLDFGIKWFGSPCSSSYFEAIAPIFSELEDLRNKKILWRDIHDKELRFYKPVLEAFILELEKLNEEDALNIPSKLLTYLIGINDFYKVISKDRQKLTQIQAYNIFGTLNRASGNNKSLIKIPIMKMPTKFLDISFKKDSSNTLEIVCNNGWAVSMRIHNASSKVEASLKFDIRLTGIPSELYSNSEGWKQDEN